MILTSIITISTQLEENSVPYRILDIKNSTTDYYLYQNLQFNDITLYSNNDDRDITEYSKVITTKTNHENYNLIIITIIIFISILSILYIMCKYLINKFTLFH